VQPDQFMEIAAIRRRRLLLATPEGSLRGYLIGMDDRHLVIYAQYKVSDTEIDWTLMTVPRTGTVLMEQAEISQEDGAVQENYLRLGGATFIDMCQARLNEEDAE
jgi:hypothetical protein